MFSKAVEAQETEAELFHFWYQSVDARSSALAGANIVDPVSKFSAFQNPAAGVFNNNESLISLASSYNNTNNIHIQTLATSFDVGTPNRILFGVSYLGTGFSSLSSTNSDQLSFKQLNLDVAYSRSLTHSLGLGFEVNSMFGSAGSVNEFTSNAGIGLVYAPTSMLSYGIKYSGSIIENNTFGSGLAYFFSASENRTVLVKENQPQSLEIGTMLYFPSSAKNQVFSLSFANEKLFGESGMIYKSGLEIFFDNTIILRGGYFYSLNVQGGRFGIGFNVGSLSFNYAFIHNNLDQNGQSQQVSLSINFN
ncbi:MAG: hypothetical protein JJ892_07290 [Balneola sp.]|nr:hypothetical protein [Balneola sp.]MBO6650935.1 hypothetical protein [Balneola sp.]MBO6711877.1 hypothetical protein [Balneola sp.]MBO6800072.1 hypothetical protein [Balneola sp.]MBO6871547.1 hypothetical protein [Balneola sp.]